MELGAVLFLQNYSKIKHLEGDLSNTILYSIHIYSMQLQLEAAAELQLQDRWNVITSGCRCVNGHWPYLQALEEVVVELVEGLLLHKEHCISICMEASALHCYLCALAHEKGSYGRSSSSTSKTFYDEKLRTSNISRVSGSPAGLGGGGGAGGGEALPENKFNFGDDYLYAKTKVLSLGGKSKSGQVHIKHL